MPAYVSRNEKSPSDSRLYTSRLNVKKIAHDATIWCDPPAAASELRMVCVARFAISLASVTVGGAMVWRGAAGEEGGEG